MDDGRDRRHIARTDVTGVTSPGRTGQASYRQD
ncbi:hypothetical protein LSAT2_015411, partial [Lamellibrachia satsuma]